MTLKMIFLGSGSAFTVGPENYQSNILLTVDNDTLLIDAGSDIRHSLREKNLTYKDIVTVYLTHLHGDHTGGLEYLALTTYFDPNYQGKPNLITSELIVTDLWNKSLAGGLSTLEDESATLGTFYNIIPIKQQEGFDWHGIHFDMVQTKHFFSNHEQMPSFGFIFTHNNTRVFFSSDTQHAPEQLAPFYEEADIIFHDCETQAVRSGVHAHYTELVTLPAHIKQKMWLYHYNPGKLPDAVKDGFLGLVSKGQSFEF